MKNRSAGGRVVILLSGEHQTLPSSEALAILRAEGIPFSQAEKDDQMLILEAGAGYEGALEGRAALTMEGGRLVLGAPPSYESISVALHDSDWGFLEGRSFGVKVTRVREHSMGLDTQRLQGEIGHAVKGQSDSRVDLRTPDVWMRGVITDGGFFVYPRDFATDRASFGKRRPKTRPYFHPGVLEPKLARVFVNLCEIRRGETFLDPFCGTGGFLIEAALMGCRAIGVDLDARMIEGAGLNLRHHGLEGDLVHGDARRMPLGRAGGISTDPPYGRGTSTMGGDVRRILLDFFMESSGLLDRGGIVCTAAPVELDPCSLAREAGFEVKEEHRMRVHKSLTRSIVVAERT